MLIVLLLLAVCFGVFAHVLSLYTKAAVIGEIINARIHDLTHLAIVCKLLNDKI